MALGAGRHRIVRQQLTEVLVLAVFGGALGVLLSIAGVRWFIRALAVNPPPFWMTFDLDYRVMICLAALIGLTTMLAGALPAVHAIRVVPGAALKDETRSSTSAGLGRFSTALVIAELAVSCGLLIAAGLMIKSVVQLKNVQMPFSIENILTARIDLPRTSYPDSAASIRFFEQLLPRLQAIPGMVPSLRKLPSGCAFRDRCDRALEVCARVTPPLEPKRDGQLAACHNPVPAP